MYIRTQCNNPECAFLLYVIYSRLTGSSSNESLFLSTHTDHRDEEFAKLKHMAHLLLLFTEGIITTWVMGVRD